MNQDFFKSEARGPVADLLKIGGLYNTFYEAHPDIRERRLRRAGRYLREAAIFLEKQGLRKYDSTNMSQGNHTETIFMETLVNVFSALIGEYDAELGGPVERLGS